MSKSQGLHGMLFFFANVTLGSICLANLIAPLSYFYDLFAFILS